MAWSNDQAELTGQLKAGVDVVMGLLVMLNIDRRLVWLDGGAAKTGLLKGANAVDHLLVIAPDDAPETRINLAPTSIVGVV